MKFAAPRAAFQIPAAWDPQVAASRDARARAAPASGWMKAALLFAFVALTVLDRFGVRLNDTYSINPALFALYGIVAVMIATGTARLNGRGALAYLGVLTVTVASYLLNAADDQRGYVSVLSLMLLLVLYAPVMLSLSRPAGTTELWHWAMTWYLRFAIFCAVAGILQFYAQYVIKSPWLFDYRPMIPQAIRGSGMYNTINAAGEHVKANGFFLREASGFSFLLAFAAMCEMNMRRRKLVLAVLGLGIVLSYSGSGLLALGVAMLFQASRKLVLQLAVGAAVAIVAVSLFGEAMNLQYTVNRVNEFESGATKSSAYCRFISPGKLALEQIDSSRYATWLGHGPGTTQKMFDTCETTYGKVVFEYGLLGALAMSILVILAINRSRMPLRLRVMLVIEWYLLGGHLLAPEPFLVIVFLSSMWPTPVGESLPLHVARSTAGARPAARRGMFSLDGAGTVRRRFLELPKGST